MTILESERLILRTSLPSDAEAMHRCRNDPLCARYQRGQLKEYGETVCLVDRENAASVGLLNKLNFENLGYVEKIDSLVFAMYPREDT